MEGFLKENGKREWVGGRKMEREKRDGFGGLKRDMSNGIEGICVGK